MTEHIMQCCYTNAVKETGGKISSGWQTVVVSEDIPSDAYASCVNLQNANSTIQSHMVDEQGNVLNLFEVTGDGAYVYVSRTQYGLTDRLGRPNMFSHAYIFSLRQEGILSDPNVFLTLTADNFAKDEESARRPKDSLERAQPFTLERALERAGLTDETYLTLIQCVYARYMDRKAAKPVFVQYDGSEEQLQAILYCIYCGLPYCVRRSLSIASAAASTSKTHHLIFSTAAASHDSFVVPQTGENNALTSRAQRRIARYGFVEHAVRNWRNMDMDAYFQQLEKLAMELGDSTASDELVLKLAHQFSQGADPAALTDEELGALLSDALRSRTYGSQRMEEFISDMLDETRGRKLPLTEESEANLAQWLAAPVTTRLPDAGEQYNIYVLSTLSAEDAARRLHNLPKPVFDRYSQTLEHSDGGMKILDHYYADYGLEGKEITWTALEELLAEASYVHNAVNTKDRVDKEAWGLYDAQLEIPGQAQSAYRSLMRLMRVLVSQDQLPGCEKAAKEHYWDTISLEDNFTYANLSEYRIMWTSCQICQGFMDICDLIGTYESSGENKFLRALNSFANDNKLLFDDPDAASAYLDALKRELRLIDPQAEQLSRWIDAVAIPDAEPVLGDILALRGYLSRQDYEGVADAFQQIAQDGPAISEGRLLSLVAEITEEECQRSDDPEHWIPIDIWLLLGRALYPNDTFRIFDEAERCVTQADEARAARQSRLLSTQLYARQADDYIQAKGKSAKAVSKWLKELKAMEKRRRDEERAEERKQRREKDGSLFDRGFAFITQITSGGDARPGHRVQGKDAPKDKDASGDKDAPRDKDRPWGNPFSRHDDAPSERDSKGRRRDDKH